MKPLVYQNGLSALNESSLLRGAQGHLANAYKQFSYMHVMGEAHAHTYAHPWDPSWQELLESMGLVAEFMDLSVFLPETLIRFVESNRRNKGRKGRRPGQFSTLE